MKKRVISVLLCLTMLTALCTGIASAAEARSSEILSYYTVTMVRGSNSGEVKIKYEVRCSDPATVGVESIEIYKSDGTYVTTITGTTRNGLMKPGAYICSGTYTYKGTAGTSYYAVVTVSANSGTVYDSRTITTSTV